jgi:hypothetical protein
MPAFAITALGGFPPPTSEDFPQFIQWQSAGTNLGLPDVDTINVSTGMTATRGTGENANTVTLTASGGGGSAQVLLQQMTATSLTPMDGTNALTWTVNYNYVESTDATWDADTSTLTLVEPGTYEIKISARMVYQSGSTWDADWIRYGTGNDITAFESGHYITKGTSGTPPNFNSASWTDIAWYQTDAIGGAETPIYAYANTYNGGSLDVQFTVFLSVTKISDEVSA